MDQPVPDAAFLTPAVWSFGFALLALSAFCIQLVLGWRGGLRASALILVVALSALAAAAGLAFAVSRSPLASVLWHCADIARAVGWVAFVLLLLLHRAARTEQSWPRSLFYTIAGVGLAMPLGLVVVQAVNGAAATAIVRIGHAMSLGLAVVGLVCIEQLARNSRLGVWWALKPLCIGLGGVFGFDLFMYAEAVLFGQLDASTWSAHGAVQAIAIPFIAIAAARNKEWTLDVAVSRQVVFHSSALLGSGLYLLGVAAAGYYIRYFGGTWGGAMSTTLAFAAVVLLGVLLTSGTLRSRLRVFVNKHFFSYRYDYREEWLRFTNLLAQHDAQSSIYERVVRALADLVESRGGAVWVRRGGGFYQVAHWNAPEMRPIEPADGSFPAFLARTGWVIDLKERRRDPARYPDLAVPEWLESWSAAWLVIPLAAGERLIAMVVLTDPRVKVDLNWEVLDLLKTAGRQAASYLGEIEANEALLETEKFAAFNRMSAFVVHDLKNLVAQLALMLKNAERHRDNPEFQRDMFDTVRHVTERMNRLVGQLRSGESPVENARSVDLSAIAARVQATKGANRINVTVADDGPVYAIGHEDRLEHVIGHLVQNAIEATETRGSIQIQVGREGRTAVLEVIDDGAGMTAEFVRTRLFKPFQTTKRDGMGIGAYESHQYVTSLGGAITVDSRVGGGTRVRLALPQPAEVLREVA